MKTTISTTWFCLTLLVVPSAAFAAMDENSIAAGLKSHDRALHIKDGWIRDPYIVLGPDDFYYLTGTTFQPNDPAEATDKYNTGLGNQSRVGWQAQVWRSRDLIKWDSLGAPFSLKDGIWFKERPGQFARLEERQWRLWAPELHWLGDRWALVHTSPAPVRGSNLTLTRGASVSGPWENPMGTNIAHRHDPSLFKDDNGTWWMIWGATEIAPLKQDFSGFAAAPVSIRPTGQFGKMGHEGCLIQKLGGKYVLFGTGWSTDKMRKGSYNLYYAVADKITGPYGERKFVGRFLGHGTPFKTRDGQWWCTAFFNANVPPISREGIETRDLSADAQTINQSGTTIVPLEVKTLDNGEVYVRAKDPAYAKPGPDEVQRFKD
jgi:arylsulfatase